MKQHHVFLNGRPAGKDSDEKTPWMFAETGNNTWAESSGEIVIQKPGKQRITITSIWGYTYCLNYSHNN